MASIYFPNGPGGKQDFHYPLDMESLGYALLILCLSHEAHAGAQIKRISQISPSVNATYMVVKTPLSSPTGGLIPSAIDLSEHRPTQESKVQDLDSAQPDSDGQIIPDKGADLNAFHGLDDARASEDEHFRFLAVRAADPDHPRYPSSREELAGNVRAKVMKMLSRDLRNWQDREDVAQEVTLSVIQSLGRYDPSRSFQSWLSSIIQHKKQDLFRSHRCRARAIPMGGNTDINLAWGATPEPWQELEAADADSKAIDLKRGILSILNQVTGTGQGARKKDRSSAELRKRVMLEYMGGKSSKIIAQKCGIPREQVDMIVFRMKSKIAAQAVRRKILPNANVDYGKLFKAIFAQ